MEEKTISFELMEPSATEALVPNSPFEPWMFISGGAVLLILLATLIYFLTRKKVTPVDPRAMREAARAEANGALDKVGDVPAREAAVISSLVLRSYLAKAAGDPALYETHEEYVSRHEALKNFSEEARTSAAAGFSQLAAIKYSNEFPTRTTALVVAEAKSLLETLHQGFRS